MPKGPSVTLSVQVLIAIVYEEHPKWKAPMVRNEVELILRDKNPELPKGWPSLSTVQKILATVRKREGEVPEEDELWHIGTIKKFPISPEALSYVIPFWLNRCKQGRRFTIREAQWVARLYALLKDLDYEEADTVVINYAWNEEALERLGFPPGFLPYHDILDIMIAQTVVNKEIDEETMSNIDKLYKRSDIELKAYKALKDYKGRYRKGGTK